VAVCGLSGGKLSNRSADASKHSIDSTRLFLYRLALQNSLFDPLPCLSENFMAAAIPRTGSLSAVQSAMQAAGKRCDLCDGKRFELISRRDRRGQPLDTGLCLDCGLVAHWTIPTDHELNAFYATSYRREYHGETTPSARRVMRAWRNGLRIYRQLKPWLDSTGEVFEIGAGIGCTVKLFELAGHRSAGIEPNSGFQSFSQSRLHARVDDGWLFDLPPKPTHDVALLVHVIEHFGSPRAALEHIHRILKPNGRLYVECPNLGAPFTTRGKLFHFAHIHNFTPLTLEMMARRCGFEVERWFSAPMAPNLEVLLRRVERGQLEILPESPGETIAALERYGWLTYHLRWSYLRPRMAKLGSYFHEYLAARRYLQWIEHECAASLSAPDVKAAA
jgi:SAM-dependent methyltransferase